MIKCFFIYILYIMLQFGYYTYHPQFTQVGSGRTGAKIGIMEEVEEPHDILKDFNIKAENIIKDMEELRKDILSTYRRLNMFINQKRDISSFRDELRNLYNKLETYNNNFKNIEDDFNRNIPQHLKHIISTKQMSDEVEEVYNSIFKLLKKMNRQISFNK